MHSPHPASNFPVHICVRLAHTRGRAATPNSHVLIPSTIFCRNSHSLNTNCMGRLQGQLIEDGWLIFELTRQFSQVQLVFNVIFFTYLF